LEEIPLKIRTNPLLSSFLSTLTSAREEGGAGDSAATTLRPSFLPLELGTSGQLMTRNLESIIETVDAYRTEESNVNYVLRQIQREKTRAESYVAKRKEENSARVAQGLTPLPEEDVTRLFKVPAEPSRLDWMLLLGQMEGYAKSLEGMAGSGLVRMYAARGPCL
jgi:translation initiation factor 3 subunit H